MDKERLRESTQKISHVLQNGDANEVCRLGAPCSEKPLEVRFNQGNKMSITASEIDGDFSLSIDGIAHAPEWLDELGAVLVTRPDSN